MTYSFTLILEGPNPNDAENLDRLYEAGCDDATFGERDGVYIADFDREASTFAKALASAMAAIEKAVPGLSVVHIEPEDLVTASEIAARTERTRESIRQLFEGTRGPGGFPRPTAWLSDRTRLWKWSEVSRWFATRVQKSTEEVQKADMISALNALFTLRRFRPDILSDAPSLVHMLVEESLKTAQSLKTPESELKWRKVVEAAQSVVLDEELNAKTQELLSTLRPGQICEGTIVRLADFGAFVDLGGIDGLIHNTELSWGRVRHPSEVVKVGDTVQVEVIKFDPEAKEVRLSLKHSLDDPWKAVPEALHEGDVVPATLTKVTANYLLVELLPGVAGMVSKSEFDPASAPEAGGVLEVEILSINLGSRRITASIKPTTAASKTEIQAEEFDLAGRIEKPRRSRE